MNGHNHTRFPAPARTPGNGSQDCDLEERHQTVFNVLVALIGISVVVSVTLIPEAILATGPLVVLLVIYEWAAGS